MQTRGEAGIDRQTNRHRKPNLNKRLCWGLWVTRKPKTVNNTKEHSDFRKPHQLLTKYLSTFLFQGDSGGPLVCKGVFHAIVSGGYKCGIANKPGIYTLLTKKYQSWIKSQLAPSSGNWDCKWFYRSASHLLLVVKCACRSILSADAADCRKPVVQLGHISVS